MLASVMVGLWLGCAGQGAESLEQAGAKPKAPEAPETPAVAEDAPSDPMQEATLGPGFGTGTTEIVEGGKLVGVMHVSMSGGVATELAVLFEQDLMNCDAGGNITSVGAYPSDIPPGAKRTTVALRTYCSTDSSGKACTGDPSDNTPCFANAAAFKNGVLRDIEKRCWKASTTSQPDLENTTGNRELFASAGWKRWPEGDWDQNADCDGTGGSPGPGQDCSWPDGATPRGQAVVDKTGTVGWEHWGNPSSPSKDRIVSQVILQPDVNFPHGSTYSMSGSSSTPTYANWLAARRSFCITDSGTNAATCLYSRIVLHYVQTDVLADW